MRNFSDAGSAPALKAETTTEIEEMIIDDLIFEDAEAGEFDTTTDVNADPFGLLKGLLKGRAGSSKSQDPGTGSRNSGTRSRENQNEKSAMKN